MIKSGIHIYLYFRLSFKEGILLTLLCKDCESSRHHRQLLWPDNVLLVKLDLSLLTPKASGECDHVL